MEVNDQNLTTLKDLLLGVLSPDNTARKSAESYIEGIQTQQGFPILVLSLIQRLSGSSIPGDIAIRQSGAVLFKNIVKKNWQPGEDDDNTNAIADSDKHTIKNLLVELMCSVPSDVQKQLAEAVTIISKYDFPAKWNGLLAQLVGKLATQDMHVTKGVMLTANSIMKRFRYVFKSDSLYEELLVCLNGFQAPLLECHKINSNLIVQNAGNKAELLLLFETRRLMTRVFFSMNWQDIPEFFEDNIALWMEEFAKYFTYTNPLLVDPTEDSEPGPIEKLQAAILENINLYATKYEDIFEPYLPQFTQLVWKLLMEVGTKPKFDILATNALKFLTTVASKQMNVALFTESVLRDIIEHIAIKNLTATEADEELFEDNPTDYIRKDMEGSDQDTRRRSAIELVRAMLKFFNAATTQLCLAYINAMLEQYRNSRDWRAKDAALHLVLAVAVVSSSTTTGAGELNPNVNILNIFEAHILPEIHEQDVNANAIVKADAIKLVCIFRSHLQAPMLLQLLPHIVRHLHSTHVVIQTYAAMSIERFLILKDRNPATGATTLRLEKASLTPFFQPLFAGLFTVLDNPEIADNEYVMKCIMRMLVVAGTDITPVTELVLNQLTKSLERVCRNPLNPHFNHYLFESLALLVRNACASARNTPAGDSSAAVLATCTQFEALMFPPFQAVLTQDVLELIPYVFQILALLLSNRPISGLSDAYRALFPPLLSPVLWERKGNVPALTDLFKAYISKGMGDIVAGNHISGVLGVFQKLLASKSTETYAFELLNFLYSYTDATVMAPFLPTILQLQLQRMQEYARETKTARYYRLFLHNVFLFSIMFGAPKLYELMESLTTGLVGMIVLNVLGANEEECCRLDPQVVKEMIIGGTKLLLESPVTQNPDVSAGLLRALLKMSDKEGLLGMNNAKDFGGVASAGSASDYVDEEAEFGAGATGGAAGNGLLATGGGKGFDNTYSKLAYADVPAKDVCEQIPSAPVYFVTKLSAYSAAHPGQYIPLIQGRLSVLQRALLEKMMMEANVTLM